MKLYMFRTIPLPIIKSFHCTHGNVICHSEIFTNGYFAMELYMFRTIPLSIIRSFSLYTRQWYTSF